MRLHSFKFFFRQPTGLFQYRIGNTDFSDVMEHSSNFKRIAEFFPLVAVHIMIKRPAIIDFNRIICNAVNMKPRFFRVMQLCHLYHA